ncbi:heme peroxidase family protein [Bradyrhizobium lablabi]|uniref:peroxidase family protein n=1 Tax=Bradyrhizobium lablabi TaxID=722472 RepID=UPI001BA5DB15|nr:heme peroxidase family protein [Bradyrhizobium lablabi]MBR0695884.1 heme peroxidase [Bradyrhizobium lablabi]
MTQIANINPRHGRAGRHPTKAGLRPFSDNADPGLFGRMFDLPAFAPPEAALRALADAMRDAQPNDAAGDNPNVPSGFTYLGQFVDHDITLDLTSIAEKQEDPHATTNFRTPRLDLDSVYGLGPDGSPQLYARDPNNVTQPGPKFLIGKTAATPRAAGDLLNDLTRNSQGRALIGDHRNDENLLVAQTHLAFLKFHNKMVDRLADGANPPAADRLFSEARKQVTWHYQWMVLHDFVERITEAGIVAKILHEGRKFYRFQKVPYMPVEFSAAAYRLGHSMVREAYSHNRVFTLGGLTPATLKLEFAFSGLSGIILGQDAATLPPSQGLPPNAATLPTDWIIDWSRFYELDPPVGPTPNFLFNHSRKIDPFLIPQLHDLPGGGGSLPLRNLQRGVNLGLPSGQDVARVMGIAALTPAEIATGIDGAVAAAHGFDRKTPLWYYILKEAAVKRGGQRLGPVGARIVAEVFIGLVAGDNQSYLSDPTWRPTLPAKTPGTFLMSDLLRFVGDISPIDGVTTG